MRRSLSKFKTLLARPDLRLGLIERANNARYFHGHVSGKVGVRPDGPLYLGVHAAESMTGEKIPAFEHPHLRHSHFESPTLAPGMRERRAAVLDATALAAAGVLVRVDVRELPVTSTQLTASAHARLAEAIEGQLRRPKADFLPPWHG